MERSFFNIFEDLEDPRNEKGKIYPLMDIIILALYGVLIGFGDFSNMSYYLKKHEEELIKKLELAAGVPPHDVFSDVFRAIDVDAFMKRFVTWTREIAYKKSGQHIALDGKAVRAAAKKAEGGNIPYVISAFLCGSGLSVGQKEVGEKTNEIKEIPELLDMIDITECFVTIDAIGTQKDIMDKIKEKGGHFCLQLKRNQKNAFEDVELFFGDMEKNHSREFSKMDYYMQEEKSHGRIEKREYRVFVEQEEIKSVLSTKWEHVECLGMAKLTGKNGNTVSEEIHYHLLDTAVSAKEYGSLAREHWEIENSLHWVLDIHFREDACTANADHALANLALLRKIAFNFTKLDPEMAKKSTKKRMIDFMTDVDLFKRLVFEVIPAHAE